MNVYDEAHRTARALKESQQYQDYLQARERLRADTRIWEMFTDFRRRQTGVQEMILTGQKPPQEKIDEINQLYEIVSQSALVREFLRAEMDLIKVVEDIQRILLAALDLEIENA